MSFSPARVTGVFPGELWENVYAAEYSGIVISVDEWEFKIFTCWGSLIQYDSLLCFEKLA